jgi:hypothetical protein
MSFRIAVVIWPCAIVRQPNKWWAIHHPFDEG